MIVPADCPKCSLELSPAHASIKYVFSGWVAKVPGKLCQQIKKKKSGQSRGNEIKHSHAKYKLALRFSDLVFSTDAFPQHRDADTSGKQRCTVGSDQARGGDASSF